MPIYTFTRKIQCTESTAKDIDKDLDKLVDDYFKKRGDSRKETMYVQLEPFAKIEENHENKEANDG